MDDKAFIQKIKSGDLSAIRALVDNHKNLIWHIIISMVGRNSDGEDLFQEVFLRVFKGLKHFRADARLSTWIGSITHHVCVDYLRRKKRTAEHIFNGSEFSPVLNIASDFKMNENGDINQLLMTAISKLPSDYRTVITLYHLDEHRYKDIAEITGMPEGTVKSYISRGRNLLREMLVSVIPDLSEILNEV
jgi:RNA polymerase sigma factor (sigma-70 family)